jgi:hypothetical protein
MAPSVLEFGNEENHLLMLQLLKKFYIISLNTVFDITPNGSYFYMLVDGVIDWYLVWNRATGITPILVNIYIQ